MGPFDPLEPVKIVAMADLRELPKVDALAKSPSLEGFVEPVRLEAARQAVAELRSAALAGAEVDFLDAEALAAKHAERLSQSPYRRVINASGIILHTGLGRARLAEAAAEAIAEAARRHVPVELDLETGKRGDRQSVIRERLSQITGAADAHVVNNCAGALFLALNALCESKKVLLSRGQMVEIGGMFRVPDIVRRAGVEMVEVGTTNRTRIQDYASVDDPDIAAILLCHPSNFAMTGFVESAPRDALVQLARERGWIVIDDLGSGALFDIAELGLGDEPLVRDSLRAGVDVALFSGDKLLGGPQAGILVGSQRAIGRIREHPLSRAFRIDKFTVAGLEATLRLIAQDQWDAIPTYAALHRSIEDVREDAERLLQACDATALLEEGLTEVGGGSAPGRGVPTVRVGLTAPSLESLARQLRLGTPSLLGRIEKGRFWLDPRTMDAQDIEDAVRLLGEL